MSAARLPAPNPSLSLEKAELLALLMLPDMNPRRAERLLTLFGSPGAAWDVLRHPRLEALPGMPAADWSAAARHTDPRTCLRSLESAGIGLLVRGERGYPRVLEEVADAPLALFCRGTPPDDTVNMVAVVGARKASSYGLEVARWISSGLARAGVAVVSGAAWGIDSAAHAAALDEGGCSYAVLGCGVDVVYPRSNRGLFERIANNGCLLSEYPPGTQPAKSRFPARNRIIAGMARGVVVVEASGSSGALITARFALQEGRDVMAVPGSVLSDNSKGTNALLRSGATPVTCPEDVTEELGLERLFEETGREGEGGLAGLELAPEERALFDLLARGLSDVMELAAASGLGAGQALSVLARLEVAGLAVRERGGRYHPGRGAL